MIPTRTRAHTISPPRPSAQASRTLEKARAWADERGIPKAFASYAELLADETIDAVYVPLPTTLHLEWVTKAANAGKHVLVEKPVGVSEGDVAQMVAACQANGVHLMDNVKWWYFLDLLHWPSR